MKASGVSQWAGMTDDQLRKEALDYHELPSPGKMATKPTKPHSTAHELALAYSPGVAYPCLEIEKDRNLAFSYTSKGNLVGVVSNGTAVLGLGNIGPLAGKPVMEGKALLFKSFADIDVFDMQFYLGYQLPYDTLNLAVIAGFFQWVESMYALIN